MSGEIRFITTIAYEESLWIKVWGEGEWLALYIGCVYMPTDSTSVAVLDTLRGLRKTYLEKGKEILFVTSMPEWVSNEECSWGKDDCVW